MSFKEPFLLYPVEEEEGYVIRCKPLEDSEECYDFKITPENAPSFFHATLSAAGIAPEAEEEEGFLTPEEELRDRAVAHAAIYAQFYEVKEDQFIPLCNRIAEFIEEGKVPEKADIRSIKKC